MSAKISSAVSLSVRALLGEPDHLRPPVLRVRRALDVAELLEVIHHLADRLLAEPGALGELREPRPALVDEAEHAAVSLADRRVPRLLQPGVEVGEAVAGEVVEQGG